MSIYLYPSGLDEFDQLNQIFKLDLPIDDQDIVLNDLLVFAFGIISDIGWSVDDIGLLKKVLFGVIAVLVVIVVVDFSVSFWTLGFEDIFCI